MADIKYENHDVNLLNVNNCIDCCFIANFLFILTKEKIVKYLANDIIQSFTSCGIFNHIKEIEIDCEEFAIDFVEK